jgi:hypothetical protein
MPMDRIKITFLMLFVLFPDLCRAQDTKKQVTAYLPSIVSDVIVKDLHTKERFRRLRKHDEQWSFESGDYKIPPKMEK